MGKQKREGYTLDTYEEALVFRRELDHKERRKFDEIVKSYSMLIKGLGGVMGTELVYKLMMLLGQTETHPLDLHGSRSRILRQSYEEQMLVEGLSDNYAKETAKMAVRVVAERGDL